MCLFHVKQALNRRIQQQGLSALYTSPEPDGIIFQRLVRKIGSLQMAPPNYINRSIELIRRLINESPLEADVRIALIGLLDYYVYTWVLNSIGVRFFSLFDVNQHRTINHAETYHGKLRHFYQPHMLLGRWLVNFQEVTNSEEETAVAIDEGRLEPNQPMAVTAEIDANIAEEKANITAFLNTEFNDVEFANEMSRYFGRIGHLIGFNPPRRAEINEQLEEEAAMEQAEASLDGSGLSIKLLDENEFEFNNENIEINAENNENIPPI